MFLFNFYSNTSGYMVLFLAGIFFSIFFFFLSMSFNSKKNFYYFLSSVFVSLMINVNQFPLFVVISVAFFLFYISNILGTGEIKYKIFTNLITVFIFGVLLISGVFSVRSYLVSIGTVTESKQKTEPLKKPTRIEIDKNGKAY